MIKKENFVFDDQNKREEKKAMNLTMADFNRLSMETNNDLCAVTNRAMIELQGNDSLELAIKNDLFCHFGMIQALASRRMLRHARRKLSYEKIEQLTELQKLLYQRLQILHHYGECEGCEIPGIAWHMEENGTFSIDLKSCAQNLSHSIKDVDREGTLITVWLNLPLLESEDPECYDSPFSEKYGDFVGFGCQMRDDCEKNSEYCNVNLNSHDWRHLDMIRDILAGMDVIRDMANEELAKP